MAKKGVRKTRGPSGEASRVQRTSVVFDGTRNVVVKEPPGVITKVQQLECWPEVKTMMARGDKIDNIVKFIQDERGEYTHAKPSSLSIIVGRVKRRLEFIPVTITTEDGDALPVALSLKQPVSGGRVLKGEIVEPVLDGPMGGAIAKWQEESTAREKLKAEGLDVISEIAELILQQKSRLSMGLGLEATAKTLMPTVSHEVETLSKLLKEYLVMCKDIGIISKAPQEYRHMVLGMTAKQQPDGQIVPAPMSIAAGDLPQVSSETLQALMVLEKAMSSKQESDDD